MAITTYAELLTAIQNYEDDTSAIVTDRQAEWVTLCENRIHYGFGSPGMPFYSPALRLRQMERTVTIPIQSNQDGGTSAGSANAHTVTLTTSPTVALGLTISFTAGYTNTGATTFNPNSVGAVDVRKGVNLDALEAGDIVAGAKYTVYYDGTYYVLMPSSGGVPLPSRYLGMKEIYLQGSPHTPLDFMAPSHFSGILAGAEADSPTAYTIQGDCIRFAPIPGSSEYVICTYWRKFAALSSATHALFLDAPNIYLYGSLLEAALYLGEDENAIKWHGNFTSACQGVANSDQRDRYGAAPLRMRVAGPTP